MLTQIPESDGRIAIYLNGTLLRHACDQAHADDWCRRYMELLHLIAPLVWEMGDRIWARLSPEERRRLSQPVREAAA